MTQYVVKRTRERSLKAIECFGESEHLEAAVCAEIAELEGLEARVFVGSDLSDVVRSCPSWFSQARQAA